MSPSSRGWLLALAGWTTLAGRPSLAQHDHHHHESPPAAEAPAPAIPDEAVTLAELEARAVEARPLLAAAAARLEAARSEARQAGRLANPALGLKAEELPLESGPSRGKVGLVWSQQLPLAGQLSRSRSWLEAEAGTSEGRLILARAGVQAEVRRAFYRAVSGQRALVQAQQVLALAREAVEVTAQLFNTGAADRPDQLAIEVDAERAELAVAEAEQHLAARRAELATAVGDTALAARPLADTFEDLAPDPIEESWRSGALAAAPELELERRAVVAAAQRVALEKARLGPELGLTAGVLDNRERADGGSRLGGEFFGEALFTLPLWNRNQDGVVAARAELAAAEALERDARLALAARLDAIWNRYRQARAAVEAYRERILPRAEEAHQLYLERYHQMAAAYPQVLLAERRLGELREAYRVALEHYWLARVDLDFPGSAGASSSMGELQEGQRP